MRAERAPLHQRVFEWFIANPLRLVLLLLLYVALPVLLVGEVSSQTIQGALRLDQFVETGRVADRAANSLDSAVVGLSERLSASMSTGPIAEAVAQEDPGGLAALLAERRALLESVTRLALLDPAGGAIAADPPLIGSTPPHWSDAAEAVRAERGAHLSDAVIVDGRSVILVAGPIEPDASSPVYVAEVDLGILGRSLRPVLGSADDVYVIDDQGRLLTRAASAAPVPPQDLTASPAVRSALQGAIRLEGEDPLGGGRRFLASAAAPGTGWRVIAVKSTAPLDRAIAGLVEQVYLSRIVLIVVVLLGAFVVARNVGELIRQRRALAAVNLRLEQASQAKSHFLASVSHELRTPMNAILGFTDALLNGVDGPLNEDQRQSLTWVQRGGRDLLELINDILDLSKIEAGGLVIHPEPFAPVELVETVVGQHRPLAEQKGLGFELRDEGSPAGVMLDRQRTRQIVVNLIGNALKFTSQGSVEVVVGGAERDILEVSVRDTGLGIPEDHLDKIFEDFRQVETGRPPGVGGTGLGLAISRRLARMMGGDIAVESASGQGSTFRVTLPIDCRKPEQRPAPVEPARRGERVLLTIDDDPSLGPLIEKMLTDTGWRVASVTDPVRAVAESKRLKPDAITLDLLMPGRDGLQILHDLRSDPATESIPVIVLTVLDSGASVAGAQAHLSKPLQRQTLLQTLEIVVGATTASA